MIYQGNHLNLAWLSEGFLGVQLCNTAAPYNVLSVAAFAEWAAMWALIQQQKQVRGLVISSEHAEFSLGADVSEFPSIFQKDSQQIAAWLNETNHLFNQLEDAPFPTVVALNGEALGAGLELALAADFRVLAHGTEVGLPAVQLGLNPAFGGSVRLPRLIGLEAALAWMSGGQSYSAEQAQRIGLADAVVDTDILQEAALRLCQCAAAGELPYSARRECKKQPLRLPVMERALAFEAQRARIIAQAGVHYPAPLALFKGLQQSVGSARDEALAVEQATFMQLARTPAAQHLINGFLNSQQLKRRARRIARQITLRQPLAVLGAGPMGAQLAERAVTANLSVLLHDPQLEVLQHSETHIAQRLALQVADGTLTAQRMADTLTHLWATVSPAELQRANAALVAVSGSLSVQRSALSEAEALLPTSAWLASTSLWPLQQVTADLRCPERCCGLHLFHAPPAAPMLEVVRGKTTDAEVVKEAIALAHALGYQTVTVNDGAGFLLNRVFFAYIEAFLRLVMQGVCFRRIDRVMMNLGWSQGPAQWIDSLGLPVVQTLAEVMCNAMPARWEWPARSVLDVLMGANRLGQRNGVGFYRWEKGRDGLAWPQEDISVDTLLLPLRRLQAPRSWSDADILRELMQPLCAEAVRCVEEGIVERASDVDAALVQGLGFPAFRGGPLRYIHFTQSGAIA